MFLNNRPSRRRRERHSAVASPKPTARSMAATNAAGAVEPAIARQEEPTAEEASDASNRRRGAPPTSAGSVNSLSKLRRFVPRRRNSR